MPRTIEIVTPLGSDVLLLQQMTAREELSRLSEFEVDLLSAQGDIDANSILGQNVTLKLQLRGGGYRFFNGYVTRFQQTGTQGRQHAYRATVHPWLWFLTRTADCRIFQDKTVPEIIKQVFSDHAVADIRDALTSSYRQHSYCVQYRETDFNFVSRLMEQEGIYYFFTHSEGRHTLVLADASSAHVPTKGYEKLPYVSSAEPVRRVPEFVSQWRQTFEIQPGKYQMDDYDFQQPKAQLSVSSKTLRKHALADYEMYDYPGDYRTSVEGNQLVRARLEELQVHFEIAHGESNARGLAHGALFKLSGQPRADQNREYLVLSTDYRYTATVSETGDAPEDSCTCRFSALSSKQPFRPQRTTPKPVMQGPQTAVVVGPVGEEIHTDKFGRVKVQFHWDRYGMKNENSSCWIRPSHPLAGKNWGMVTIPRIGQEVIVDFLEGDPDQPIITGRVYNAEQVPPWELPANMTQSGVLTRSTKGATAANANAIRFEDKKGSEQLWLHAEKNQDIEVENDETHWVGHDRTQTVDHNEAITVGWAQSLTVGKARSVSVGADDSLKVGKNLVIEAGDSVTIKTGSASILMKKDGTIQIKGTNITMEASGKINVKASGDVVIKGSKILQN